MGHLQVQLLHFSGDIASERPNLETSSKFLVPDLRNIIVADDGFGAAVDCSDVVGH